MWKEEMRFCETRKVNNKQASKYIRVKRGVDDMKSMMCCSSPSDINNY